MGITSNNGANFSWWRACILSKSDNREISINDKADDVIKEPFQSLLFGYQNGLKT